MSEVIKQWDETSDETHETSTKKMTELQKTLLMDVEDETLSLIHISEPTRPY